MRPNILLISVDQMRGDCLSSLGHPVVETPNLDALARTGVTFTHAYSATPSCIPARAAIFTGMGQRSHGRVGYQDLVPWRYEHMLPAELMKAGYHTQCVGKMHVYPTRNLCGFHNVVLHDGYMHYNRQKETSSVVDSWDHCDDYLPWLRERAGASKDLLDLGLDCNASAAARPWELPEELHPTNWVVSQSIDFLRRRDRDNPFFLWMSFVRPHPPLDPPQAFFDMYRDLNLSELPIGDWIDEADPDRVALDPTTLRGAVRKNRLNHARAAYYALITHIDYQIGRFLNAMYEYGVAENTVILFTSDHGEMMGDHQYFRKCLPYEGSAKIPFILSDPHGLLKLKNNTSVDRPVELRDIMPTLLDAAQAAVPHTVEGKSLIPLARQEQVDWREYIHGEHTYGELSYHSVTDGKEKFIWFSQSGEEQFFDLVEDPEEKRNLNLHSEYQGRVVMWRERLIAELADREEGMSDGQRLIAGRKARPCLSHLNSV